MPLSLLVTVLALGDDSLSGLGELHLGKDIGSEYYRRSLVVPGDPRPVGRAMARARERGSITITIVGGSTSSGGGYGLCGGRASPECGELCCGQGYFRLVANWLLSELGITTHIHNGARGATGPELPAMCLESMFSAEALSATDLVLVEFAINTGGSRCVRTTDRMLWRIRKLAPHAAIIFVHTFSLHRLVDASEACLNPLAHMYRLPAVSWKAAVYPLLADDQLSPVDVFQPPAFQHPNIQGHRHLASIVAHFLLSAEARARELSPTDMLPVVRDPDNQIPMLGSKAAHERLLSYPSPACITGSNAALIRKGVWEYNKQRKLYQTAKANATLSFQVHCKSDQCGVIAALSQSYQPLGKLDILVDGAVIHAGFSEVNLAWRAKHRNITVNHFQTVVPANRTEGLQKGKHVVSFRCRGETEPQARQFPSGYRRHEVQVRGIIVFYRADDAPRS